MAHLAPLRSGICGKYLRNWTWSTDETHIALSSLWGNLHVEFPAVDKKTFICSNEKTNNIKKLTDKQYFRIWINA